MKQVIFCVVMTFIVESAFGHVVIDSNSTDGDGTFVYEVVNLCSSSGEEVLPFGLNSGVYLAEGPAGWSFEIRTEETVFFTDDPEAYIPKLGSATLVLYSDYIYSTYVTRPIWVEDRLGNEQIVGAQLVLGPAAEPPFVAANIDLDPDTLNLKGKHKWITAYIGPPESYTVEDIDISTVILKKDGFETAAESCKVQEGLLMVKFPCEQLKTILEPGSVELTVAGELSDGTFFEGTDIIKIIDNGASP